MLRAALLILAATAAISARADSTAYYAPDGVRYDPATPTPAGILGHELGEQAVRFGAMQVFLHTMAERSDRISIETIGTSHEGRPINLLVITSPENHARIDEIRAQHVALSDPDADADISDDMPAVVWLGYGVHGAEAAGMETAIPVVYHLAAGRGEKMDALLRNTVILVVTVMNPDGHSRRIDQKLKYKTQAPVVDPAFVGHDLWASFRSNHYWFDLNRQWLLLAHPEPRAWLEQWHKWKPNLTNDFHEMGTTSVRPTTYYFSPGEPKRKFAQIPDEVRGLKSRVAEFHTDKFDGEKRLYFTEEAFDNFYVGTGSSYPDVNGSLGFLFEVGTARAGTVITGLGKRTYADNIRMHYSMSLSTLEAAQSMRRDLLAYQKAFSEQSLSAAGNDDRSAFVFTSPDRSRLAHFVDVLTRHQLEVYSLARDITVDGVDYRAGDAYITPMSQPQYRMLRSIFDRNDEFGEAVFYDVSGWTLPLAYNLDYAALQGRAYSSNQLGAPVQPEFPSASPPPRASYGYMFSWTDHYAPKALYSLLDRGIIARVARVPVEVRTTSGTVAMERGSIFVPLARQTVSEDDIHRAVSDIASDDGITVHAVTSGRTVTTGADLGSGGSFDTLEKPRVLVLFDDGIQSFDAGEIWHLMDFQMEIPAILKQKTRLDEIDWPRYTHLVLPGGKDGAVGLSDADTAAVRQWVREYGGTIIGLRQGADWVEKAILDRGHDEDDDEADPERHDYAEFSVREAEHVVGGTIFASDLDITHPLGYGYHKRMLPSHRDTSIVLETPDNPYAVVAKYREEGTVLSGYASERRVREIAGSPMMLAERVGSGTAIMIVDNPAFRATYLGTNKLFLNSLFFSRHFSNPRNAGGAHYRP
ncbi:MAG: M14 family zinc carboxypeptidase [Woeseia sp.]